MLDAKTVELIEKYDDEHPLWKPRPVAIWTAGPAQPEDPSYVKTVYLCGALAVDWARPNTWGAGLEVCQRTKAQFWLAISPTKHVSDDPCNCPELPDRLRELERKLKRFDREIGGEYVDRLVVDEEAWVAHSRAASDPGAWNAAIHANRSAVWQRILEVFPKQAISACEWFGQSPLHGCYLPNAIFGAPVASCSLFEGVYLAHEQGNRPRLEEFLEWYEASQFNSATLWLGLGAAYDHATGQWSTDVHPVHSWKLGKHLGQGRDTMPIHRYIHVKAYSPGYPTREYEAKHLGAFLRGMRELPMETGQY